ncbi:MAG: YesL family protein [Lachnospiraceae bacterium]|nr:YesL family protein [Lachnospiraceae bacterium]
MDGFDGKKKKKKNEVIADNTLIKFLTKFGHVIMLNIAWFICCIPVVTIGSATTSLYYAMIKNVRRDRGYPMVEFFTSFKRTIFSGSAITLVAGAWMFMLYHLKVIAKDISGDMGIFMDGMYTALMIVTAGILVYLFPVLSRFVMKTTAMAKLSFVMAIRFLPYTVLILVAAALMAWLIFYHLPLPTVLFIPGVMCYASTYLIEPVMKKYMPKPKEDEEDAWYYQ